MIPAAIPGAKQVGVQPKDWDEATMGRVGGLPFKRVQIDGIWFIETAWTPSSDEIADLVAGGSVILRYSSPHVLVTSVGTSTPPLEIAPLTHIKAGDDYGHCVVIWDEDADAKTTHDVVEVNCAEGWAIVYVRDGNGDPIIDGVGDARHFRKARIEGNFTIRWAPGEKPAHFKDAPIRLPKP